MLFDIGGGWILAAAFRETHVLAAEAEEIAAGAYRKSHTLACGIEQTVYEDPLQSYEHPFFPWWFADYASCRGCAEAIELVHDRLERQFVRNVLRESGS